MNTDPNLPVEPAPWPLPDDTVTNDVKGCLSADPEFEGEDDTGTAEGDSQKDAKDDETDAKDVDKPSRVNLTKGKKNGS